jgi:hypothetical protein
MVTTDNIPKAGMFSIFRFQKGIIGTEFNLKYFEYLVAKLANILLHTKQSLFVYCFPSIALFATTLNSFNNYGFSLHTYASFISFSIVTWLYFPFIKYCWRSQPHVLIIDDADHLLKFDVGAQIIQHFFQLHNRQILCLNLFHRMVRLGKCFEILHELNPELDVHKYTHKNNKINTSTLTDY